MTENLAIANGHTAADNPPTITRLGTLHELTLGAFPGTGDALGGYDGDQSSIIF